MCIWSMLCQGGEQLSHGPVIFAEEQSASAHVMRWWCKDTSGMGEERCGTVRSKAAFICGVQLFMSGAANIGRIGIRTAVKMPPHKRKINSSLPWKELQLHIPKSVSCETEPPASTSTVDAKCAGLAPGRSGGPIESYRFLVVEGLLFLFHDPILPDPGRRSRQMMSDGPRAFAVRVGCVRLTS